MDSREIILANIRRYRRFLQKDLDPEMRARAERALELTQQALIHSGGECEQAQLEADYEEAQRGAPSARDHGR
jgi:hypothetical protein